MRDVISAWFLFCAKKLMLFDTKTERARSRIQKNHLHRHGGDGVQVDNHQPSLRVRGSSLAIIEIISLSLSGLIVVLGGKALFLYIREYCSSSKRLLPYKSCTHKRFNSGKWTPKTAIKIAFYCIVHTEKW